MPLEAKCPNCDLESFKSIFEFNKHIKKCFEKQPVRDKNQCEACEWTARGLKEHRAHWNEMHKNKPLPYLCYACDYRTYTKFYMDQHEKVEHKTEDFTCETCGYKTKHQHAIKRHLKYVHDDSRNYQCEVCAKSVKTHKQLKQHLITKHGYTFEEKEMKSLMKIITKRPKLQKIEAKCLKCDLNSFKDIFDFNEHVRLCYGKELNQGIKFKCNKKGCETIWRAAEVLHFHLYDTHKTNENVCDICGKIFPYNIANLKRHKENTHFLKRDYQCDKCDKVFSAKNSLQRHVNEIHLGFKPFECEQCSYKIGTKNKLAIHIQAKHTDEPFKCRKCDFFTRSHKTLRTHQAKYHSTGVHSINCNPTNGKKNRQKYNLVVSND